MQRFYIDTKFLWDFEIILNDQEIIYQLVRVLRVSTLDEVIFFNCIDVIDYVYKISSIDKKNIIFNLSKKINKKIDQKNIILYQALPNKIDKIEEIIQKWTEIWYKEFNFYRSKRSQSLYIWENKITRFEKIIKESVEQSNINYIPKLNFLEKIDFKNISWENMFFHTEIENSTKLNEIKLDFKKNINIFVWPEWWFDDEENEVFLKNKFIKVNLWNNILRTENTPIVVWFYLLQNN